MPAVICILAGLRGFDLFWVYMAGYAIAGGLAVWAVIAGADGSLQIPTGDDST